MPNISNNTALNSTEVATCLLYPYFYAMHLYQPTVKDGERLKDAFKQGNWYAPSYSELARVIYYRGYSVNGNTFSASDVREAINANITVGTTA
jgi:hypothetical protein